MERRHGADRDGVTGRMTLRWLLASFHLLALPLGLGAIVVRARALRGPLDESGLRRVFRADALWGLAAALWISTGIWRAFGGLEKGTAYYMASTAFQAKMALLLAILVLEVAPMIGLIKWRLGHRKGQTVDVSRARLYSRISVIQAHLVILMVFMATAMARGMFV